MTKTKTLKIYRDKKLIQSVVFQKTNKVVGWQAIHFDRTKYMPFNLYDLTEVMKQKLEQENLTYEWQ